ncbi:uncharacterized protein LOC121788673 [Salvia splendens]|uniref:uncharacterized protein LOC121788673 n=1 Tax=Salvia splendens TaxID=180675 RepID=UPI001C27F444|nr:uncharacterized protein LOC121788673 [Salvia splendens]
MSDDEEKPNMEETRLKMSKNVTLAVKLNGMNYPLWKRLMRVDIVGRRANRYITGTPQPPEPGMKGYTEWEEADMTVFSWIIDNVETEIVVDFAHHQTAQALWESLQTTFESTADPYLLYDLEENAGRIEQGEHGLETYWRHLHGIWVEIDRCQHQPVDCCDEGISQLRTYVATRRLFKFLTGLNARYDGIRRDILKETPLPSAETAYGLVKQEATRLKIMPAADIDLQTGAINDGSSSGQVGHGFAVRNQPPPRPKQPPPRIAAQQPNRQGGFKPDKSKFWCSHCGKQRHTRDTCFLLVGFPEWWDENQKAKARLAIGVEDGGGLFLQGAGNREMTNTRGRAGDTSPQPGGGGRPGDAAFAEKK